MNTIALCILLGIALVALAAWDIYRRRAAIEATRKVESEEMALLSREMAGLHTRIDQLEHFEKQQREQWRQLMNKSSIRPVAPIPRRERS